jgi:hypothetical protein
LKALRAVLLHTGLEFVHVKTLSRRLKLPPLEEFIPNHFASTSLAAVFASAGRATQATVISDVTNDLQISEALRESEFSFEVNLGMAL